MTDHEAAPIPRRKHLLSPDQLEQMARTPSNPDLTRRHGDGNGLWVHGIYIGVVSLVVFVVVIVAIVIAGTMMMM